nr:MAG TPA: hypothetical protein [Caudoviricetes sp.]
MYSSIYCFNTILIKLVTVLDSFLAMNSSWRRCEVGMRKVKFVVPVDFISKFITPLSYYFTSFSCHLQCKN